MLYSTSIKINGTEYMIKIGLLQIITAKKIYKINIMNQEEISDLENIIKILHVALKFHKDIEQDFDKFVEWLDNSDTSMSTLCEAVTEAISLGLHKKSSKELEAIETNYKDLEEVKEVKNS